MIRIRSCIVRTHRPGDTVSGEDVPSRFVVRGHYEATLDLVVDREGLEQLRAVLAREFGRREPLDVAEPSPPPRTRQLGRAPLLLPEGRK